MAFVQIYADHKILAVFCIDCNYCDSHFHICTGKAALIAEFARSANLTLRCHEVQTALTDVMPEEYMEQCARCVEKDAKATLCPKYHNLYNNILKIKKALEFLEIGTITSPDNKRKVLSEGWKLHIFQNARLNISN